MSLCFCPNPAISYHLQEVEERILYLLLPGLYSQTFSLSILLPRDLCVSFQDFDVPELHACAVCPIWRLNKLRMIWKVANSFDNGCQAQRYLKHLAMNIQVCGLVKSLKYWNQVGGTGRVSCHGNINFYSSTCVASRTVSLPSFNDLYHKLI